jgi:DNA-binding transcriptional MocR family regulator
VSLDFEVDRNHTLALYLQITEQIKDRISDGRLPANTRLPTVRQLAMDLGVTRLTIQNAYSTLQEKGWIEATVGRGTFVSNNIRARRPALPAAHYLTPDSVIDNLLQVSEVVGFRSLASAYPDPKLFPADEFWGTFAELRAQVEEITSYGSSQGDPTLRVEIAKMLVERDMHVMPDEILVTAGATQGLALTAQALAHPGEHVLVEEPTYLGLLHTLKAHGLIPVGVPLESTGPKLDILERLIVQYRPRFFYTIPNYQNPTGICMAAEVRTGLLAIAQRHGLLIIEDDIYARLAYDGPSPTSLMAVDTAGLVVHVSSFSKTLMPGLRLGYVIAPAPLREKLHSLRRAVDLCSPPFLQRALALFLRSGGFRRHMRRVLPIYRERRDAFCDAMRTYMPPAVCWHQPGGGFCAWLSLPRVPAMADLPQAALQQGWAYAPGEVFLTQPSAQCHLRLCFGNQTPESIRSGIAMLARLIRERLDVVTIPIPPQNDWMPLV